jgi:hypothetical protein
MNDLAVLFRGSFIEWFAMGEPVYRVKSSMALRGTKCRLMGDTRFELVTSTV